MNKKIAFSFFCCSFRSTSCLHFTQFLSLPPKHSFFSLSLFCVAFYYSIAMSTLIRGCYILPISIESIISCELALSAEHIHTLFAMEIDKFHLSRVCVCAYSNVPKIQFEMSNRLKAPSTIAAFRGVPIKCNYERIFG